MHIEVEREKLLRALELAARISTKHQTLPVLQCVLVDASGGAGEITLRVTNLELGFEVCVAAHVKLGGVLAVSASVLTQTIALLHDIMVTLKTEGEMLVDETGKSRTTIKTLAHDEFPLIPQLAGAAQT